jgi:hypothetical protein
MKIHYIPPITGLGGCYLMLPQLVIAQTAQFEYDLRITADPSKRASYLKKSGEGPSV